MSAPAVAAAPTHADELRTALRKLETAVGTVVRGKPEAIRSAVIALLAGGHILIEDVPGVGKTTLARSLAAALGGTFRRIQFTSDLLPSDIVGVSIYDQSGRVFEFKAGPLFANVVLADEINRTTPRTQSALLEAMSDNQVSVDGTTHDLPAPFMVLATQNPTEHYGTYPLPESQMDRFLLRIELGYPGRLIERELLRSRDSSDPVATLTPTLSLDDVRAAQAAVTKVTSSELLLDYAMAIVEETRKHPAIAVGVSTRGALAWTRAAQAAAFLDGRDYCVPDDFKQLAVGALAHRLTLGATAAADAPGRGRSESERIVRELVARVPVPT